MPKTARVIERMHTQCLAWEQSEDQRAIFLRCYSMMTSNMVAALGAGRFHDAKWATELMHLFAEYYFIGLRAYDQSPSEAPAVWRFAHDAAKERNLHVMQHLFLGINAHINYDLVLTIVDMLQPEWHQLNEAQRQLRYEDHCKVNEVIAETIDRVQDTVIERYDPLMDVIDRMLGRVDEMLLSRLITHWRETVWQQAMSILACQHGQEREMIRLEVEAEALKTARWIVVV